ncbi:MAG: RDD family protein [Actinomycetota bacterium]
MTYIGVGRRFMAWFVDILITGLAWVPFAQVESGGGTFAIGWRGMDFALPMLITVAYFVLLEGLAGATVGKFVLGIRVRGLDGSRIGLGPALVRNLARVVDAFPYVIPYLVGAIVVNRSDTRQRLGDRWARTVVILMGTEGNVVTAPAEPAPDAAALPSPPPGSPPAGVGGALPPPPPG